ncbi:Uncharacterized protein TCM_006283 [Theobroma cacao]|uniref:Uncharacterized protein n=1 Tax=Theobroma cacao TaxID=3641 RepID=A0A061E4N5_THECC|nr:Uncharacterized protein TCM_006283 [Theobroma cacao]
MKVTKQQPSSGWLRWSFMLFLVAFDSDYSPKDEDNCSEKKSKNDLFLQLYGEFHNHDELMHLAVFQHHQDPDWSRGTHAKIFSLVAKKDGRAFVDRHSEPNA